MKDKPILLVDFDGVLHSYTSGWKGARVIADPPVDGAIEWLIKIVKYFDVCIYSARSRQWGGKRAMKKWLFDLFKQFHLNMMTPEDFAILRNVPDYINGMDTIDEEARYFAQHMLSLIKFPTKKPPAFLTIDDRCIQFKGVFPGAHELINFKPWNGKGV